MEVSRWLEKELGTRTQSDDEGLPLRELIKPISAGPECEYWTWSLSLAANDQGFAISRQLSRGWGDNPDDGEWETITVHALAAHANDTTLELEEFLVSPLDLDKKRESIASLGRRFRAGLAEDSDWAPLLDRQVSVSAVVCG
jgi:hypothetical protein